MRKHTGIKPFACERCGKSFQRKVDMRRHFEICMLGKSGGGGPLGNEANQNQQQQVSSNLATEQSNQFTTPNLTQNLQIQQPLMMSLQNILLEHQIKIQQSKMSNTQPISNNNDKTANTDNNNKDNNDPENEVMDLMVV